MRVSYSGLYTYLHCPWLFDLKYKHGWEDGLYSEPRDLGSAVHIGIEAVLRGKELEDAIFEWNERRLTDVSSLEEADAMNDNATLAVELVNQWRDWMDWDRYATAHDSQGEPLIEYEISVDVTPEITLHGVIDWVCEDKHFGGVYVVDWKTRQQFTNPEQEQWNVQKAMYQWMLMQQEPQLDVAGSMLLQIRNKDRAIPKLNKNGTMSRAAITTDWATYKQALIDNDLDPAEYEDMEWKLADYHWFSWTPIRRSKAELQGWIDWAVATAEQTNTGLRRPGSHCSHCWARSLCLDNMTGLALSDADFESYGFVRRKKREESS